MLPEGESYQYNGDKMKRKPAGIWFESGAVQRAEVTFPSLCPLAVSPAQFSVNKELLGLTVDWLIKAADVWVVAAVVSL